MMRRRNAIPRNERQAQAKERALAAIALMRREGMKLRPAAKATGTSPITVWRYAGSALRQQRPGGRIRDSAHDRIARSVNFITPAGRQSGTSDSRTASALGEHLNAVKTFVNNRGDSSALKRFENRSFRVSGQVYQFVTDPATLEKLADAGELAFE